MIRLDDALSAVTLLGLDTPPFIYFVERHPSYVDIVREIFQRIDSQQLVGCSSVITLTEVLSQPARAQNRSIQTEYRNLLLSSRGFNLIPVDAVIAETAADLRARYRLRTPDALQIASALNAGCEAFLTNDAGLRNVNELRVVMLNNLEL